MSAHKKVGTFRKVGGAKQGGNVATYFCRPDETVIHVIPGPVDADTFLREARWAVDVDESAALEYPDDVDGRREHLRLAHATRFLTDRRGGAPKAGRGVALADRVNGLMPKARPKGGDAIAQAHWLLWSNPLPPLAGVYRTVWTDILNEQVTDVPVRER